jgi:hypothetical protein
VGGADAGVPFYRVRGGAGRPGVGEERVAAVVCHNSDEGSHFGRGSAGVVVGSDEVGGAQAVTGAELAPGGCAHTREVATAVVGLGTKMTGWGLHVSRSWRGERRREVRRFPTKEAASGQSTTDWRPSGPRGQAGLAERPRPSGKRESEPAEGQVLCGWAENQSWAQFKK